MTVNKTNNLPTNNLPRNSFTQIGVSESDTKLLDKLKIISWNIQSSNDTEGSKFKREDFLKIIDQGDIICLQEVRQANKIPGFRSKHNLRDGSNSGGVSFIYKNHFHKGMEEIKNHKIDDLIICKLKRKFFKLEQDIFIINAYVTPQNSSGKINRNGKEMLLEISDIINELKDKGGILICGDYNSRIADEPGLIKFDDHNDHLQLPEDYVPDDYTPRNSQDKFKNNFCTNFLSLISNNLLTILNGRTLGDLSGAYTCIKSRGCSVVDYFASSEKVTNKVQFLEILPFTNFSDHCPLLLTLQTSQLDIINLKHISELFETAPARFIINQSMKETFTNIQETESSTKFQDEIRQRISLLTKSDSTLTREKVTDIVNEFTGHLQNLASACFKTSKGKGSHKRPENEPWFSSSCKRAKKELQKATRSVSQFTQSEFLRTNFYHVKNFTEHL